jgi:hypothetical protein
MTDTAVPTGGVEVIDPVWSPWHPEEVADRLASVDAPWYVAAGWALDLWRGRQSRAHEDVEIGIPLAAFSEVRRALTGYEFDVVGAGCRWPVDSPAFRDTHQTWVREPATGVYRLDVFREPHDGDTWIFRRDVTIRLPYAEIIHRSGDGIPYLAPEIVLLFKAKGTRPKDQADFAGAVPLLDTSRRTWLREALIHLDPGHPWLESI